MQLKTAIGLTAVRDASCSSTYRWPAPRRPPTSGRRPPRRRASPLFVPFHGLGKLGSRAGRSPPGQVPDGGMTRELLDRVTNYLLPKCTYLAHSYPADTVARPEAP